MSDSSPPPSSPPPPLVRPRRMRSWALAAVLSLVLVTGWAMYLAVAPTPEVASAPAAMIAAPDAGGPFVATQTQKNQVRLLAWRNAIDADVLAAFAADTGLKVIVDGYDSNEELQAMLTNGGPGITQDVVLLSGVGLKALLAQNALRLLPKSDLVNAGHVDPALAARTAMYDVGTTPSNVHAVPILWGTIGLGYNATKIAERLGGDVPLDSWSVLFDPAKAAKLADCGIQVIDSPTGVFPTALKYLNLPPDSAKPEDTEAAARLWENVRASVSLFSSQGLIDNLATGRTCLAMATSGDAYQARNKARTAGLTNDIRYVLPKESQVVWYDFLAIPKAATNADNALRLIDYLLRPEVAARLTNSKGFANAVTGAALYVKPEIKTDAALSPDLAKLPNAIDEMSPSPAAVALRNRFWQLISTPDAAVKNAAP